MFGFHPIGHPFDDKNNDASENERCGHRGRREQILLDPFVRGKADQRGRQERNAHSHEKPQIPMGSHGQAHTGSPVLGVGAGQHPTQFGLFRNGLRQQRPDFAPFIGHDGQNGS